LIDATVKELGRLDILVNNAGMSPLYENLASVTEALYDKTLDVNLKGPFRLAALAATYMAAREGGSVINIGTIGSIIASPNELPYSCAKAGLNAMTIGMAEAFAPKVRVNAILPGAFRTGVSAAWTPEMREGGSIPFKRIGEPNEIAGLALYLAGPAASYTTGAIIRVDGGAARKV
jgi:NAD(P)-dependent dehydrogenase (short-subunit alcohol dehydrogenase family)